MTTQAVANDDAPKPEYIRVTVLPPGPLLRTSPYCQARLKADRDDFWTWRYKAYFEPGKCRARAKYVISSAEIDFSGVYLCERHAGLVALRAFADAVWQRCKGSAGA